MKKYLLKESGEELKFGDLIQLDLCKDTDRGTTLHQHLECKFSLELLPWLLESGIVEEAKDNIKKETKESCEGDLENRVIDLEGVVADLINTVELLKKNISDD